MHRLELDDDLDPHNKSEAERAKPCQIGVLEKKAMWNPDGSPKMLKQCTVTMVKHLNARLLRLRGFQETSGRLANIFASLRKHRNAWQQTHVPQAFAKTS